MKKNALARKILCGLLAAGVVGACGSALAASFSDGIDINETLSKAGNFNVGISAPSTDTVVDKDASYKFILNQGTVTTNNGVGALYSYHDNSINTTFNGKTYIFASTNLTGTGNNSSNGLLVYGGTFNFNKEANITAISLDPNGKSVYGIEAYGDKDKIVHINFNGDKLVVNAEGATDRTGAFISSDLNSRGEIVGINSVFAAVNGSKNTDVAINVLSKGTTVGQDYIKGKQNAIGAAYAYGILAESGVVDFKGNSTINVNSKAATAIGVKVTDGYYTSTVGENSGDARVDFENANVVVSNDGINGKATGFFVDDSPYGDIDTALLTLNKNLDLTVTADAARGVQASNGKKMVLGSADSDLIKIVAKSTNAANAANVNIGIVALKGGKVDINTKDLTIESNAIGDGIAYGLTAQNNTTTETDESTMSTINLKADNIKITSTSEKEGRSNAIVAMSQGRVNVHGNLEATGDSAITARGNAKVRVNTDAADANNYTKLNGDIKFAYDEKTSGTNVDADVEVNLNSSESVWNGNATVDWSLKDKTSKTYEDLKNNGTLTVNNFKVALQNSAQWNPTTIDETIADNKKSGQTNIAVNELTLNDGIINLDSEKLESDNALQIENIKGTGGTINTNSVDNTMVITQSKANDTKLVVNGTKEVTDAIASGQADLQQLANVVSNQDGETSLADTVTSDANDIIGGYSAEVGENGKIVAGSEKTVENTTNRAISDMASISLMTWRQENNDMNKRLGELRDSKGEHGAWARMARGESKYGVQNVKNQYNYYQVGYDEKLSVNPNWTVGVALTRTEGSSTFATGSGENKHTGFAVYGSYLADNGSFLDLIAKYARMDNDYKTIGAGVGDADYETNGYSLSAEYGKRFTKDNGFWIEPQVELTYGKVGSASYTTSKGANVYQDGVDSLVGRLGFSFGKDIKQGNVYVRASYLYDFDGETTAYMSKAGAGATKFEQDLGGGWWEVGVGTNLNLSDATHLYFDVEKTYGGNVATPWQWNAGVRWSF